MITDKTFQFNMKTLTKGFGIAHDQVIEFGLVGIHSTAKQNVEQVGNWRFCDPPRLVEPFRWLKLIGALHVNMLTRLNIRWFRVIIKMTSDRFL